MYKSMSINTRAAVKALNAENPKALKGLSDNFNFDFEKEFIAEKKVGSFTVNAAKKEIAAIAPEANNIVILIKRANYWRDRLHVIQLLQCSNNYSVGNDWPKWKTYQYNLDTFYSKKDAEEVRKHHTGHYYIIAQSYDHQREKSERKIDRLDRQKLIDAKRAGDGRGNTYYNELTLRDTRTGDKWTYKPHSMEYNTINGESARKAYNQPLDYTIDKSGYLMLEHHKALMRRLRAYKAQKIEAYAAQANFADEETQIVNGLKDKRLLLAKLLESPKTYAEMQTLDKMLDKYKRTVFSWENYQDKKSTENATARKRRLENLKNDLEKIKFDLYMQ